MIVAMSPELKVVNGSKDARPDQELLDKKEIHPSRIREFGRNTGLAIMSKDNEPRISFAAYLIILLIALLIYGGVQYGIMIGVERGRKEGIEATKLDQLSEKLMNLEKEKAADERQKNAIKAAQEVAK